MASAEGSGPGLSKLSEESRRDWDGRARDCKNDASVAVHDYKMGVCPIIDTDARELRSVVVVEKGAEIGPISRCE
jgi:hypothetical protein